MNATSDENIGRTGEHIEREGRGYMGTTEYVGLFISEIKGVFRTGLLGEYLIGRTFGNRHALKQDSCTSTRRDGSVGQCS